MRLVDIDRPCQGHRFFQHGGASYAAKIDALQIGEHEIRIQIEFGVFEIGVLQLHAPEIGAAQIDFREIGVFQAHLDVVAAFLSEKSYPGVPGLYAVIAPRFESGKGAFRRNRLAIVIDGVQYLPVQFT